MKNALNKQETHVYDEKLGSTPALGTNNDAKLAQKRAFFVSDEKPAPKNAPFRKRFIMHKRPYKLPKIIKASNGDWRVRFWYEYPDKPTLYKAFDVRDGINRIHDLTEREKEAKKLAKDIKYWLEVKSYNPFEKQARIKRKHEAVLAEKAERAKLMTLEYAHTWFIEQKRDKNKSIKTLNNYSYSVKPLIEWCKNINVLRIDEVTIDHIEDYLASRLSGGWSARSYNNACTDLTTFFNYLVAKRKMPVNPIGTGMLERIKNTAEKNKYYDEATLDLIRPEIKKQPQLQRFINWTYYTCARGSELRALKIKDIDTTIKKITITAESGKTGEHVGARHIPICSELMEIIDNEGLKELNPDWYVFGKGGEPSPEKVGHGYFSDKYLSIKNKLNLDSNYSLYSFKHTRVCQLLVSGFEPIKVMYLTGHTDWGSFQKYIRELGVVMDKVMTGETLKLDL